MPYKQGLKKQLFYTPVGCPKPCLANLELWKHTRRQSGGGCCLTLLSSRVWERRKCLWLRKAGMSGLEGGTGSGQTALYASEQ